MAAARVFSVADLSSESLVFDPKVNCVSPQNVFPDLLPYL